MGSFKLRFSENLTSSDSQKNLTIDEKIIKPSTPKSILKKTRILEENPDYMNILTNNKKEEENQDNNNNINNQDHYHQQHSSYEQDSTRLDALNGRPILLPSSASAQNQLAPLEDYLIPEYLQKIDSNAVNLHPASIPMSYNRLDPQQKNQQLLQILQQQQNCGMSAESCFSSITSA